MSIYYSHHQIHYYDNMGHLNGNISTTTIIWASVTKSLFLTLFKKICKEKGRNVGSDRKELIIKSTIWEWNERDVKRCRMLSEPTSLAMPDVFVARPLLWSVKLAKSLILWHFDRALLLFSDRFVFPVKPEVGKAKNTVFHKPKV